MADESTPDVLRAGLSEAEMRRRAVDLAFGGDSRVVDGPAPSSDHHPLLADLDDGPGAGLDRPQGTQA